MAGKNNVLFLCTGNSCRSQMAEGFLRHCAGDRFEAHSAGTDPAQRVHPLAVQVMAELDIDISGQQPKGVKEFLGRMPIRYLIIVCDGADQSCPRIFPGEPHRVFEDPARLEGEPDEVLAGFRRVRDEIRHQVESWLATIE